MLQIGLDFAPGTTDDCKKLVRNISPDDLFNAYRLGRHSYNTGDLVVVVDNEDHENFQAWPRSEYVKRAVHNEAFTIAKQSAHQVMLLPAESDAFWLVVEVRQLQIPVMCVLHAVRNKKVDDTMISMN